MKPEIHRILVPLDFSPASDRALAYARALSTEFGAPLFLLHVIEDRLMTGPWPSEVYLGELPKLREDLVKDAERRMRLCLESLEKDGLTATGEVLIGGPSHVIIEQADGNQRRSPRDGDAREDGHHASPHRQRRRARDSACALPGLRRARAAGPPRPPLSRRLWPAPSSCEA